MRKGQWAGGGSMPGPIRDLVGSRKLSNEERERAHGPGWKQGDPNDVPEWLNPEAQELFAELTSELAEMGVNYSCSRESLAAYCDIAIRHREFCRQVPVENMEGANAVLHSAKILTDLAQRNGMTMVTQAKVMIGSKKTKLDPMEQEMYGDLSN